jgi:hypothetical protein
MFKNIFKKKKKQGVIENLGKFTEALHPTDVGVTVVYEEITEFKIKGELFRLGDKVITRSNECGPLIIGTIIEFWDNSGKWDNCIPQVKSEDGNVWGIMGHIKHYSDELMGVLEPMRPLEQWNYLIPDHLKEMYSYSEERMIEKETLYNRIHNIKENLS